MIGLLITVIWAGAELAERWRVGTSVLTVLLCVVLGVFTWTARVQVSTWKNSETVARQALKATGENFMAEVLLGNWLEDQGDEEAAITQHRHAIATKPDHFVPYTRLGILLDKNGRQEEAIKAYAGALKLNDTLTGIQLMLGRALQGSGQIDAAVILYKNVLKRTPYDPQAHYLAGTAYETLEAYDKALTYYTESARLDSKSPLRDRLTERLQQEE